MAHPNEDLVREGFAAFGRGDMDALRDQIFAEDIRYHIPGRSPVAGNYEGIEQVLHLFARIFELSGGTFRTELHDVVANDEHATALFTIRGEKGRSARALRNCAIRWVRFCPSRPPCQGV